VVLVEKVLENTLNQNMDIGNQDLEVAQNSFLKSTLGMVINTAVDLGIRAALPNIIEDQVINIKDAILNSGFESGINQAINSAIDLGKSAIGIVTGNFENVTQARNAIKNGGIIDSVSTLLDTAINKAKDNELIPVEAAKIVRRSKNSILDAINSNIESEFMGQMESIEKINNYEDNWKNFYNEKNFEGMEKEYLKIKNELKKVLPIESTLKSARTLETLHLLMKNKEEKFTLSDEEYELANQLVS
jgi:hypothetical protein